MLGILFFALIGEWQKGGGKTYFAGLALALLKDFLIGLLRRVHGLNGLPILLAELLNSRERGKERGKDGVCVFLRNSGDFSASSSNSSPAWLLLV